jgi:hypothetical protein
MALPEHGLYPNFTSSLLYYYYTKAGASPRDRSLIETPDSGARLSQVDRGYAGQLTKHPRNVSGRSS